MIQAYKNKMREVIVYSQKDGHEATTSKVEKYALRRREGET